MKLTWFFPSIWVNIEIQGGHAGGQWFGDWKISVMKILTDEHFLSLPIKKFRKNVCSEMVQIDEPLLCWTKVGLAQAKSGDYISKGTVSDYYPISEHVVSYIYELAENDNIPDSLILN